MALAAPVLLRGPGDAFPSLRSAAPLLPGARELPGTAAGSPFPHCVAPVRPPDAKSADVPTFADDPFAAVRLVSDRQSLCRAWLLASEADRQSPYPAWRLPPPGD